MLTKTMDRLTETYWRLACCDSMHRWMIRPAEPVSHPIEADPNLDLEIVSHCWNYPKFLAYQLSSLIIHPPKRCRVQMTVHYAIEDTGTAEVLGEFSKREAANVSWNFVVQPKPRLFRRAIARNQSALATKASWIWFTDCDQVFGENCLDSLCDQLRTTDSDLLFPRIANCTELLEEDHELLNTSEGDGHLREINPTLFTPKEHAKAIGALQVLRGDIARRIGYCKDSKHFQQPVNRWKKTYEDRLFRRLVGSQGDPVDIPNLYRIEHIRKGRKEAAPASS